tara:strand:+ start:497 stop:1042 length:546 start_codon:yes stop_codon:yes gene_type:complete
VADTAPKTTIHAGDSFDWESDYSDYPASSSWEAIAIFQKPGNQPIKVIGTASGTKFTFTVSAGESGSLEPGRWTWAIRVSKTTTSKTVETGEIEIRPNPEASWIESYNEKCLRLVKEAMEERLTDVQESISILGQDITKIPAIELERLLDRFQMRVNREHAQKHRLISNTRRRKGRIILRG